MPPPKIPKPRDLSIDFGVLTNIGQKAFSDLWLNNYGNIDMEILSIYPEKPDANLEITLITKSAFAGDVNDFLAAQLVFTATVNDNRYQTRVQQKKNIIVHTNNPLSPYIIVPYEVSVVLGAIILSKLEPPISENHKNNHMADGIKNTVIVSEIETDTETDSEADSDTDSETVTVNDKYDMLNMQNVFVISDPRSTVDIGTLNIKDNEDQLQNMNPLDGQNNRESYGNNNESKKKGKTENNKNNNNSNSYDFTREFYFKNIFPVPIRMLSVSTVSCGKMFSIQAPFLEAGHNSKDMIKNNNIRKNKNNKKNDKTKSVSWTNFIKIDKQSLNYSVASIAGSYQNWPAVIITFHQDIAMAGKLKTNAFPKNSVNTGIGATSTSPVGGASPLLSQNSLFTPAICWLEIHSNKSTHRIPMYVVDGRVRMTSINAVRNIYSYK